MIAAEKEVGYGAYNLWELYEYGEHIRCKSITTFLHFLFSEGTKDVRVTSLSEKNGADFQLLGPIGDYGEAGVVDFRLAPGDGAVETGMLELLLVALENPYGEPLTRARRAISRALAA